MSWTLLVDRQMLCQVFTVEFQEGSPRFRELIGGAGGVVQFRGDAKKLKKLAATSSPKTLLLQSADQTFVTVRAVRYERVGDMMNVTAFFGCAAPGAAELHVELLSAK